MKFTIYEDPRTHKFTLLRLPNRFVEGDELPAPAGPWFDSREEAFASHPDLLSQEE